MDRRVNHINFRPLDSLTLCYDQIFSRAGVGGCADVGISQVRVIGEVIDLVGEVMDMLGSPKYPNTNFSAPE